MELSLHFQTETYRLILYQDFNLFSNDDLNYWLDYNKNIEILKDITDFFH